MNRFVLLACVALLGCRKSVPATPTVAETSLPPIEVSKDGAWLFTYVDDAGAFATVDKLDAIPAPSRRVVRVVDATRGAAERRDSAQVYVVDAEALGKLGKVKAKALSREAFETGALSQLPPGESSAWPRNTADLIGAGATADGGVGLDGANKAVVTVYGASWCGACKAAKQYLSRRKIPYAEFDIEKDERAARALAEKAARLGVSADRIPVIEVQGRLLIGFDEKRLEAVLGNPI